MEDQEGRRPRSRRVEVPGLSPVRAFLVVCTIATVLGGAFFATREASPSEPPTSAPPRSPDYSLSDAEAIARFHELHELFRTASINRDESLLGAMLTAGSPLEAIARRQIGQLIDDQVLDRSRFHEEGVDIVENAASRIVIEQVVLVRPKFVSAATGEIVSARPRLRQDVRWVLALEQTVWKVYDSKVVHSRRVR